MDDDEEIEWPDDGTAGGLARRLMTPDERSKYGGASKWEKNTEGRWVPPPLIDRFLEEVCLAHPSNRPTQKDWAQRNGVAPRTIAGWKRDERFQTEWNRRLGLTYAHPDTIRKIVENLAHVASEPGPQAVAAAKQYLEFIGMVSPPEMKVTVQQAPQDLGSLDDRELVALIRGEDG